MHASINSRVFAGGRILALVFPSLCTARSCSFASLISRLTAFGSTGPSPPNFVATTVGGSVSYTGGINHLCVESNAAEVIADGDRFALLVWADNGTATNPTSDIIVNTSSISGGLDYTITAPLAAV